MLEDMHAVCGAAVLPCMLCCRCSDTPAAAADLARRPKRRRYCHGQPRGRWVPSPALAPKRALPAWSTSPACHGQARKRACMGVCGGLVQRRACRVEPSPSPAPRRTCSKASKLRLCKRMRFKSRVIAQPACPGRVPCTSLSQSCARLCMAPGPVDW